MASSSLFSLMVTAPQAAEPLLLDELRALGAAEARACKGGASCRGGLEVAYRICLTSRLATRVLLPVGEFVARDADELYEGVAAIDWSDHLGPRSTMSVGATTGHGELGHTLFVAQRVKDAVVDQFRARHAGLRPSVELARPDVRLHARIQGERVQMAIDLAGQSLHRRGYRQEGAAAPLKENLAALMLMRAEWPAVAQAGGACVDPMCGCGTLPIEAALMAADIAPGLLRDYFGFLGWRGHSADLWKGVRDEAKQRARAAEGVVLRICGSDHDPRALLAAVHNARRAGVAHRISLRQCDVDQARPAAAVPLGPGADGHDAGEGSAAGGVVVCNPPYGERLGSRASLAMLYATLGDTLRTHFSGWTAWVLTADASLGKSMGLRATRRLAVHNGPIPCHLLELPLHPRDVAGASAAGTTPASPVAAGRLAGAGVAGEAVSDEPWPRSPELQMVANRLRKNQRRLAGWLQQTGITSYRLYDADIPEYAAAVDVYDRWVHVQEYAPPAEIPEAKAQRRLDTLCRAVMHVLQVRAAQVFVKQRARQRAGGQYGKLADGGRLQRVAEPGSGHFFVNFEDHLDTGLFLDHRLIRQIIRESAAGADFLNLFCYTASASVAAAMGGARTTTSVDLSNTYLDWAQRNLQANGFAAPNHRLVRSDCMRWLQEATAAGRRYDLIFVNPPTFSNSKNAEAFFDLQRHHAALLRQTGGLLRPNGRLIFSTHASRFAMACDDLAALRVEELTASTIPRDFQRGRRCHRCWMLRPR